MTPLPAGELDPYSRHVVPLLLARFPGWEPFATLTPRPDGAGCVAEFNVPCPSAAAESGLWVSTADEELSVGFHTHHSHFTDYDERLNPEVLEAGMGHAADLLAERIGVVSWYRDGDLVGTTYVGLPHPDPLWESAFGGAVSGGDRMTLRSWFGRFDRDEARD